MEKMNIKQTNEFVEDVLKSSCNAEERRQESLLSQSSRILVFESLLTASIFMVWPTLVELFSNVKTIINIYILTFSLLSILILIASLISQWRRPYLGFPETKAFLERVNNMGYSEEEKGQFYKDAYADIIDDLIKKNDIRLVFVNISHIILLIQLICTILLMVCILLL